MLKYHIVLIIFLAISAITVAQPATDTIPKYIKNPKIPVFTILTVDSTQFSNSDIPIGKPLIIVYFSPTCTHCRAKAKILSERIDSLKNSIFIWASYHPLPELKEFSEHYGFSKFKNVIVGRDINYFFPTYFRTTVTPYVAIYNNNGYFEKDFRHGSSIQDIIEVVNKR